MPLPPPALYALLCALWTRLYILMHGPLDFTLPFAIALHFMASMGQRWWRQQQARSSPTRSRQPIFCTSALQYSLDSQRIQLQLCRREIRRYADKEGQWHYTGRPPVPLGKRATTAAVGVRLPSPTAPSADASLASGSSSLSETAEISSRCDCVVPLSELDGDRLLRTQEQGGRVMPDARTDGADCQAHYVCTIASHRFPDQLPQHAGQPHSHSSTSRRSSLCGLGRREHKDEGAVDDTQHRAHPIGDRNEQVGDGQA